MSGKFKSKTFNKARINDGDHNPTQCNHQLNGQLIHFKPLRATDGKEMIRTFDGKATRELLVPKRDTIEIPGIWPQSEFHRLKNQSHVLSKKDRMELINEAHKKKVNLQAESDARKEFLRKAQLQQRPKPGSKLGDVEDEAAKKNLNILQRAFELRQEQEDEIIKANSLILATKCMAIRQAQIAEKNLIQTELQQENRRLDMMMEQERQKGLQQQEEKRKNEEARTQGFVTQIVQQIKENDVLRLLEAERKEEEARMINKSIIAMKKEEIDMLNKKHENTLKTNADLRKSNEETRRYKLLQEEEQKIADMRVQEFMRKKQEREDAREAEQLQIKKLKEREIIRLRELQERAQDTQAIKDELNARRIQEEMEKNWRDKEKAAALMRKQTAEDMRLARNQQIDDIRRAQALKLTKDEEDFQKCAKLQRELFEKDVEDKKKRKERAFEHRKELLKQVNEKERERIMYKKHKFEEGDAFRLEQELREIRIGDALKRKIQYLRDHNVPENYINDIKRQLNVTE